MSANKDLNRLKVVLVEKTDNWDVRQQRYRNGAPIHHNLHWRC